MIPPAGHLSPLRGIWRVIPSPELTEILAEAGLDFQILDREHGRYDYDNLLTDLLACERAGCRPLVRVSTGDPAEVQRCLDLGAQGLVFPRLAGYADFERAASSMEYAPSGTRGFNPFVRAGRYGKAGRGAGALPRPWFVPIVETLQAVEQIETIAQLDRIDFIYIGAYDLSAQLGCPGRMDDPRLLAAMNCIADACRAAGTPVGQMVLTGAQAEAAAARGVQVHVHGVESHRLLLAADAMFGADTGTTLPTDALRALERLRPAIPG